MAVEHDVDSGSNQLYVAYSDFAALYKCAEVECARKAVEGQEGVGICRQGRSFFRRQVGEGMR